MTEVRVYHIEYKNGDETIIFASHIKTAIILAMYEATMKDARPDIRMITSDLATYTEIEIKYRELPFAVKK